MDKKYIIETKNLTKQYGSQKSVADLNIHVQRGRIYGLLGRNGAGKTTTMKMLLGLTKPTSGEVKIWGKPLQENEKKLLPRIGSLIESPGFYPNLTATENLRIFAALRGVPNNHAIKDALDLVGLPYKDKKLFSQYSLGMKQRLAIALAVMHDPELLILDEPINGLDPIGIAEVRSFIRELCDARGKTILISSHILSEISLLADDIGIIDHGILLEEESLSELEQKSSKHIRFTLSDTAQAARILERTFHESHFSIQDDHKVAIEDERKDYLKALSRQCKRETLFCDMDDYTVNLFSSEDTYPSHFHTFEMDGFTVRIENSLLAEALENLDGKKRDVILRYYFLGFDDTEISKILEVNRSTIQRRRHAGLEFIKKFMEEEA